MGILERLCEIIASASRIGKYYNPCTMDKYWSKKIINRKIVSEKQGFVVCAQMRACMPDRLPGVANAILV